MILNQCIVLQTSTPNVKTMNLPAHPFQQKITLTRPIILDTVRPRDTPPTGLVQENVLATMESVMVEMIVLTALMKDKIFVVSGLNSGWTQ